jgi:NitT/TauT family transport system substrate-binding protein
MVLSASCSNPNTSTNATDSTEEKELTLVKVSEVTHSLFYAPQYIALKLGYFEEEGLNVVITNAGGADKVMTAVISGDANIGFCGPEQSVYVFNQGHPNYPINFAQLTKRDGSFIIGREANDAFTIEDLRGKHVIGGRKGGMPVMALEYTLKSNGLEPGVDVEVDTSIAFDAMTGAFISGVGDYVTAFEPTAGNLEKQGNGFVQISLGTLSGEIPYTCYNARREYIAENESIIKGFVKAIEKGQEYVLTHSGEEVALNIVNEFPDSSVEEIAAVVERYKAVDAYATSTLLSEESYNRLLDILDSAGELTARPKYEDLITTKYVGK